MKMSNFNENSRMTKKLLSTIITHWRLGMKYESRCINLQIQVVLYPNKYTWFLKIRAFLFLFWWYGSNKTADLVIIENRMKSCFVERNFQFNKKRPVFWSKFYLTNNKYYFTFNWIAIAIRKDPPLFFL